MNPALDPTRKWEETDEVLATVTHLVKPLAPQHRRVLEVLSNKPDEAMSAGEISDVIACAPDEVRHAVERVNQFSEAMGYLPLISAGDGEFSVSAQTAKVALYGLKYGVKGANPPHLAPG
ncbi:hypothetical protein [Herbidospora sp. NBRC 101105]|uniref:hypothetical protein n=1 Tax=Herbidospora sp. NBRC 101105 TaxID=3032195 RepID=UPI002554AFB9|nr:hypothetical protein [Herbidospora sp. NBRC 101105]